MHADGGGRGRWRQRALCAQVGRPLSARRRARAAGSLLCARRVANRTTPERIEAIAKLRRLRFTAAEIAETLGMALSTVSRILTRSGMGRLGGLGLKPAVRYERSAPVSWSMSTSRNSAGSRAAPANRVRGGVRQHANPRLTDRAGRIRRTVGWEYVHIAVDDYSRLAYAEVLSDEKAITIVGFLRRVVAFYQRHGIQVERLLTDNGVWLPLNTPRACLPPPRHQTPPHPALPPADKRQSRTLHPHAARRLGLRRDLSLKHRTHSALDGWLWHYNHRRRHSALGHQPPASKTNLLGSYN